MTAHQLTLHENHNFFSFFFLSAWLCLIYHGMLSMSSTMLHRLCAFEKFINWEIVIRKKNYTILIIRVTCSPCYTPSFLFFCCSQNEILFFLRKEKTPCFNSNNANTTHETSSMILVFEWNVFGTRSQK